MNVEKPEVMNILRQRSLVEPSTDYDRSKAPGKCGIQHDKKKIQDAHVKLKRGLSLEKQNSPRRTLFS